MNQLPASRSPSNGKPQIVHQHVHNAPAYFYCNQVRESDNIKGMDTLSQFILSVAIGSVIGTVIMLFIL